MRRRTDTRTPAGPGLGVPGVGSGLAANQRAVGVPLDQSEAAANFQGMASVDPTGAQALVDGMRPDKNQGENEESLAAPVPDPVEKEKTPEEEIRFARIQEFQDMTVRIGDKIRDPKVRDAIEDRLDALNLEEYIFNGYAMQHVAIAPGVIEAEFRSMQGIYMTWINTSGPSYERTVPDLREMELLNVLGMRRLSACLHRLWLGGTEIPLNPPLPALDQPNNFFDQVQRKAFVGYLDQRAAVLYRLGDMVLETLLVNLDWFTLRVRGLADSFGDNLGNS